MRFMSNVFRLARVIGAALIVALLFAAPSSAQLLDYPNPGHPSLTPSASFGYPFLELTAKSFQTGTFVPGTTSYDGNYLTITTYIQWVTFQSAPSWSDAMYVSAESWPSHCADYGFSCGVLTVRARVDSQTGALIGNPSDTDVVFLGTVRLERYECSDGTSPNLALYPGIGCGDGIPYALARHADLSGTLLTGRVVDFGSAFSGTGTGRFNFRVAVTGGLLVNPDGPSDPSQPRWCMQSSCWVQDPADLINAAGFDVGIDISSTLLSGSFAQGSFAPGATAQGTAGTVNKLAGMYCTGIIGDRVWNDLNHNGIQDAGEPGVSGAAVTLLHGSDPPKTTTTGSDGAYNFTRVCGGDNQIDVAGPQWYRASPANQGADREADSSDSGVIVNLASGSVDRSVDFGFYQAPVITSSFMTFPQNAWGAKPKPGNAARTLADYFNFLYPTGEVVIGIPDTLGRYSITLTGADTVQTFLPQGGMPQALDRSYVDPPHINLPKHKGKFNHHFMIGQFAGNVLALRFNVDFSNAVLTRPGLASLKVVSGPYAGKTVGEILSMANSALGGDPVSSRLVYFALNEVIEAINRNFNAGTMDKHFLQ